MNFETITQTIREVVNELSGQLPDSDLQNARIFLDAGEPGVALENLCAQIYEYDVPIARSAYLRLEAAGRAMSLDSSNWSHLTVS
ncbi:MafI family immunity protein [Agromyces larvae]|uniref:MafI family immunity protein n=1 Tax=Agromyces larvae TaxID=2929802 RepID=A0ABY4BYC8_9MICO|nr:MafI family immunity protein [Agromyces larvae]UOE42871.1 MafI family immunity protein [Agromyces larvae]